MEQTSADPGVCGRFWVVELPFRGHPPDGRRRRGPGVPVSLGGRPEEGAASEGHDGPRAERGGP
ncbi:hypothetical protein GCM10027073_48650 [Streptomyces chlorus]